MEEEILTPDLLTGTKSNRDVILIECTASGSSEQIQAEARIHLFNRNLGKVEIYLDAKCIGTVSEEGMEILKEIRPDLATAPHGRVDPGRIEQPPDFCGTFWVALN
ncbi:hypothetical protein DB346_22565 [Verrucomicrobia bacterium LW23]|nr:hypothetical protein DB346_22565 [Verrucomicrobia bacterium LW23]